MGDLETAWAGVQALQVVAGRAELVRPEELEAMAAILGAWRKTAGGTLLDQLECQREVNALVSEHRRKPLEGVRALAVLVALAPRRSRSTRKHMRALAVHRRASGSMLEAIATLLAMAGEHLAAVGAQKRAIATYKRLYGESSFAYIQASLRLDDTCEAATELNGTMGALSPSEAARALRRKYEEDVRRVCGQRELAVSALLGVDPGRARSARTSDRTQDWPFLWGTRYGKLHRARGCYQARDDDGGVGPITAKTAFWRGQTLCRVCWPWQGSQMSEGILGEIPEKAWNVQEARREDRPAEPRSFREGVITRAARCRARRGRDMRSGLVAAPCTDHDSCGPAS